MLDFFILDATLVGSILFRTKVFLTMVISHPNNEFLVIKNQKRPNPLKIFSFLELTKFGITKVTKLVTLFYNLCQVVSKGI